MEDLVAGSISTLKHAADQTWWGSTRYPCVVLQERTLTLAGQGRDRAVAEM
jgi:hypothetical protein